MVRKSQEWPDEGELIVGTVYKVLNYGAFAKLEEYEGKEAFIHISEVSSGWVKNIRDYVRENQKIILKGEQFILKKLLEREVLIEGKIKSIEVQNEK